MAVVTMYDRQGGVVLTMHTGHVHVLEAGRCGHSSRQDGYGMGVWTLIDAGAGVHCPPAQALQLLPVKAPCQRQCQHMAPLRA